MGQTILPGVDRRSLLLRTVPLCSLACLTGGNLLAPAAAGAGEDLA